MENTHMDELAKALEAFKSGDSDTLTSIMNDEPLPDTPPQEEPAPEVEQTASEEVPAPETSETTETEEPQEDASVGDEEPEASVAPELPDTEEIFITDDSGRRKYTIDYTDRDRIKKAFEYAAGFRKMQARGDKAIKEVEEIKTSYAKLEDAWGEGGIDGIKNVIVALSGNQNGVEEFLQSELEERQRIASMSPEERAELDRTREEEARRLEWETKMRTMEDKERTYHERIEREQEEKMAGFAQTALDRYNFNGKLGSSEDENLWNKMVWSNAIELLEKHSSDDTKFTQSNFLKAFEVAHANLSRRLRSQVSKQVDKEVGKKKASTAKDAASAAKRSMAAKPSAAQDINADIESGDITSGIQKIFGATKKLF
jgi:hypothetical protein